MKTLELAGTRWCVKNLEDATGNQLFSHRTAEKFAKEQGLRLPTRGELDVLCELPQVWDAKLGGKWFAENEADLKNPKKSLFLPANGERHDVTEFNHRGNYGFYWSSTPCGGIDDACLMGFNSEDTYLRSSHRSVGFSVRCVAE